MLTIVAKDFYAARHYAILWVLKKRAEYLHGPFGRTAKFRILLDLTAKGKSVSPHRESDPFRYNSPRASDPENYKTADTTEILFALPANSDCVIGDSKYHANRLHGSELS